MKIIHCADLHLDSRMTANLDSARARERKAEILSTFTRMVDYAAENQVDAILIAGDMFDSSNISALTRNTVKDAIEMHPDIDFYYLLGNHDRDSFLASLETIPENLKLFDKNWKSYTLDGDNGVILTAIELSAENSASCYNSLALDPADINIVMLHGQEAVSSVRDKAEIINLRELKNKNIDYLALGHVHSYKMETLDGRGMYCYSGCLEGRGFDEAGEHGFVLLNVDCDSRKIESTFVNFANRKMKILEVDITGIMTTSEIIERIDAALITEPVGSRNLLKLVLTGSVDIEAEKDITYILKHYEPIFYFVKVYDESKLKVDYEEYKHDISLKGEYVRKVLAATDIDDEEKAEIIRIGMQAIAGEEIQ